MIRARSTIWPVALVKNSTDVTLKVRSSQGNETDAKTGSVPTCDGKVSGCVTPPSIETGQNPVISGGGAKYAGKVTLQLIVTTQGKPEQIQVLKGLSPELGQEGN